MAEMKLLMMLMVAAVRNRGPESVDPKAQLVATLKASLVNADGLGEKSERKIRQDLMPVGSSEMTMFPRKGRFERHEWGKFWCALCESRYSYISWVPIVINRLGPGLAGLAGLASCSLPV